MVSGAYRAPFVIDTREHAAIVGVHFRPAGAAAFFGVPPGELSDTHVDLASLWGTCAAPLRERLSLAPDTEQRFEIFEQSAARKLLAPERTPSRRAPRPPSPRPGGDGRPGLRSGGHEPASIDRGVHVGSRHDAETLRTRSALPARVRRGTTAHRAELVRARVRVWLLRSVALDPRLSGICGNLARRAPACARRERQRASRCSAGSSGVNVIQYQVADVERSTSFAGHRTVTVRMLIMKRAQNRAFSPKC